MVRHAWTARKTRETRETRAEVLWPTIALAGKSGKPAQMEAYTWRLQAMPSR